MSTAITWFVFYNQFIRHCTSIKELIAYQTDIENIAFRQLSAGPCVWNSGTLVFINQSISYFMSVHSKVILDTGHWPVRPQ